MDIPKIINIKGHEYIFVKQNNSKTYLYKNTKYGYYETFDQYDLGLIKQTTVIPRLRQNMNMKP
jgi:hypothetical protein